MPQSLINAWRKVKFKNPPFVFPGDEILLSPKNRKRISIIKGFSDYYRSDQLGEQKSQLQLGLLPLPYWGNLRRADIFILMLNPGLGPINFYSEFKIPIYRKKVLINIRQRFLGNGFQNISLNPQYCWEGGFTYWTEKFKGIISLLMNHRDFNYQKCLSIISRRIACLQLVPYHSTSFKAGHLVDKLKSSKLAINYVHEKLLPRARQGEIKIIVIRGNQYWGLSSSKNIIIYGKNYSRGGSLSVKSRGGKMILRELQD